MAFGLAAVGVVPLDENRPLPLLEKNPPGSNHPGEVLPDIS
jgi:hypothetical protein